MHGTFERPQPERRHLPQGGASRLVVRILIREAAVGCTLHLLLGRDPVLNAMVCMTAFAGLLVLTNRHGLLRHRTKLDVVTECVTVLMGGLAFRSLLAIALTYGSGPL